jgi:ribosome biogenesis GTPase
MIPGIKGFGIVDMERRLAVTLEFFKLKDQCKFNNCLHKTNRCAIKAALEKMKLLGLVTEVILKF